MPLSRLAKMRSNVNVVQPNETMEDQKLPRLSIADLQTRRVVTTQRQLLHRQYSDTYAESLRSNAFLDGSEPGVPFLNRTVSSSVLNQQTDTASLHAVTPKPSIDVVRPLGAPTGKLDIEQAINLLQELKKTASPEELVSLHRALLPVKEVSPVFSPQVAPVDDSTFSGSVPPDRRRSVMPPGLATRNGLSEDVLRKPQYSATVHTPSRERREMWVHAAERASGGKQARAHDPPPTRPETPSEQPNTGSYSPGTLRITNGAASPEPSIISKIAAKADGYHEDRLASSETSADVNVGNCIQQPDKPRLIGPRYPQRKSRATEKFEVEAGERPRSRSASKPSVERRRFSFDQTLSLPASPSAPRFQQRWSHRAVHLSQQYLTDCEIGESPFDESTAHLELAKRLSSVRDIENDDEGQFMDPHANAMSKLTGDPMPSRDAENARSDFPTTQGAEHEPEDADLEPPVRALRKVDSGYGSDIPTSPHRQHALREAMNADELNALPVPDPQTPRHEQNVRSNTIGNPYSHENASMYTFKEILGAPRPDVLTDLPPADVHTKRSSPLSFFKSRNKVPKKSSSVTLHEETTSRPTLAHSMSSPLHGPCPDAAREPKRLQKRVPDSVRRQRQLDAEKLSAADGSTVLSSPIGSTNFTTERTSTDTRIQLTPNQDVKTATPETTDDGNHRFRLRGKSFGRKRSKTNASEHSTETVLHTPAFRTRNRRSVSASGNICPDSDTNSGSNCLNSSERKQQSLDQESSDSQTVARALTSHPPHHSTEINRSISVPKSVQDRHQSGPESAQRSLPSSPITQNSVHELPRDVPMPSAPPRGTLEGHQRVIPIGAHGSVEDLFPEWQSRPAATPPPVSTSSPAYLQVRQSHHPRGQPSVSSIPPLPELPTDIASKVSRADKMVAKKMMNSPQNSARNSPLPSSRNSEDTPPNSAKRPAVRPAASQNDVNEDTRLEPPGESSTRWSVDGSIPLSHAGGHAKPSSPTHDSQHPGWPGWEKQADLWRQRKIGLGHALKRSVDMVGKIPVDSEFSPPSPSIVVSRYITPLGAANAHNTQSTTENNSSAKKLAQAYTYLLADDKENWPSHQNVQRTDSVDSTATYATTSSDGRAAKVDISRTGSAYSTSSTATSNTSTGGSGASLSPLVEKQTAYAPNQAFTPYRPADAVRAERSRALSLARRSCNIPAGRFELVPPQPQNKSTSVLDRYSGGLGYGWDRSTGFGGSAGTRNSGTENVNRKSVKISEDYGLDLSDIPVFLRKAQAGN